MDEIEYPNDVEEQKTVVARLTNVPDIRSCVNITMRGREGDRRDERQLGFEFKYLSW